MAIETALLQEQMTMIEKTELQQYEAVIERGFQTFYEVGQALMEIRDKRLYRGNYSTFEDYCRERWNFQRARANDLIGAAKVMANLESTDSKVLPANEWQARPLTTLEPEQQIEAWQLANEISGGKKITSRHVEAAVKAVKQVDEQIERETAFDYKRDAKSSRAADEYTPQGFDACQTPAYALDPLLRYIGWSMPNGQATIWEPAAGEGLLVGALYDAGLNEEQVVVSDILTGQNFFDYQPERWDMLITNPPYSLKYKWLERCYQLGKPFALLLPVETLGAKSAQDLMQRYGFEMLLLNRRVAFKMPVKGWDSHPQFPVFWLCWKLLPETVVFGEIVSGDYE